MSVRRWDGGLWKGVGAEGEFCPRCGVRILDTRRHIKTCTTTMYKIPKEISQCSNMFRNNFKLKLDKHQTDPSICLYLHSKKRVQVLQNLLRHSTVGTHVPDQCLSSMQVNSIGGLTQGQFWNLLLHATLLSRP